MSSSSSYQLDLVKYWSLIGVSLGDINESKMKIWGAHPLGKGLLFKALRYFEKMKDYQQVGIIAALLFKKEQYFAVVSSCFKHDLLVYGLSSSYV